MDKTILVIIGFLFLISCETNKKTDSNSDNLSIKDSAYINNEDSIKHMLRPLSAFITKENTGAKRIQDTLLAYPEIKNILDEKSDTSFDVNLYVVGTEEKDEFGNLRSKFSPEDLTVCLWAISRKTPKININTPSIIKHGDFHFSLNSNDFYVTDSTGRMSIEDWCKKQHIKK